MNPPKPNPFSSSFIADIDSGSLKKILDNLSKMQGICQKISNARKNKDRESREEAKSGYADPKGGTG